MEIVALLTGMLIGALICAALWFTVGKPIYNMLTKSGGKAKVVTGKRVPPVMALMVATLLVMSAPGVASKPVESVKPVRSTAQVAPDVDFMLHGYRVGNTLKVGGGWRDLDLQTATPEVTITIPTGIIFAETNNWIVTFAPIASIGIGITVALAVLGYIGAIIKGAFKS